MPWGFLLYAYRIGAYAMRYGSLCHAATDVRSYAER